MADAVIAGAGDDAIAGVEVIVKTALEADAADVLAADGILLGTPENFGYMSGALKYFFDRVYYPCLEETQGLPWGLFIRAGNDGLGAKTSIQRIVTGLKWRSIGEPLIVAGEAVTDADIDACTELGMTLAAGLEAGIY